MFTGIIEEVGTVKAVRRGSGEAKLVISCRTVLGKKLSMGRANTIESPTHIGDSISVNGVCLTVTELKSDTFIADVMPETFSRSNLNDLRPGSKVNLERAMPCNGRFGGHIVSGHIDGIGKISSMTRDKNALLVGITASPGIVKYIVEKGSVAIDGISLTVTEVSQKASQGEFRVSVIPHTFSETSLSGKKHGDTVNLETDMIGKYVERLLQTNS